MKQTRASVSIRGATYRRLQVYAGAEGMSVSDIVERAVAGLIAHITDPDAPRQCTATDCGGNPCPNPGRGDEQLCGVHAAQARRRAHDSPARATPARDDSPETACRGAAAMPISGRRTPEDAPHTAEVQRVKGEGVAGRRDGRIEREKPATPRSWCGSCGASFAAETIQPHRCVRPRVARPSDAQKAAHAGLVKAPMPRTIESAEATQARIAREGSEARPAPAKAEIAKRGPSNVVVF